MRWLLLLLSGACLAGCASAGGGGDAVTSVTYGYGAGDSRPYVYDPSLFGGSQPQPAPQDFAAALPAERE